MWRADLTERLSRWADGERVAPQRVLMYPTNNCNLRCPFCYQELQPYDYSDLMPHEKWIEIADELCRMGTRTLQISGGGEALVRKNTTLAMIRKIKEYDDVEGRMVTNGTIWNDAIVRELVDLGWNTLIFSIDGPEPAIHDFHRGVEGSFEKTTGFIRAVHAYKEQKGVEMPLLEFSSVITNRNYLHVEETVKLAYSLGVKVITFEPVFVSNPYVHKLKLNEEQNDHFMREIAPRARERAESFGIIHNLHTVSDIEDLDKTGDLKEKIMDFEGREGGETGCGCEGAGEEPLTNPFYDLPCFEPWCWPKIEANGEIGPCSTNTLEGENIRNKTFEEVWFGPYFERFRQTIREKDLPSGCSNCVSTHVPINKEIRARLIEYRKSIGKD